MFVGLTIFAVLVFCTVVYISDTVITALSMWRDTETLSKISYRAARVTHLLPHRHEIGIQVIVDDFNPCRFTLGARESLVRQLEVGQEYIFVCVTGGTVAIDFNCTERRTTPEQDLQLARKYYYGELT